MVARMSDRWYGSVMKQNRMWHILLTVLLLAVGAGVVSVWIRTKRCCPTHEGIDPSIRWSTGGLAGPLDAQKGLLRRLPPQSLQLYHPPPSPTSSTTHETYYQDPEWTSWYTQGNIL